MENRTHAMKLVFYHSRIISLQRINELNGAYLSPQYPLLFLYGEDCYREDIPFEGDDESIWEKTMC